jgi:hypothetical protein
MKAPAAATTGPARRKTCPLDSAHGLIYPFVAMRSRRRRRLILLLVPAFVAHLLCVCARPALAGSGKRVQDTASPASAHACCRKGADSQKTPQSRPAECRYCSAPQLAPPDAPKLAAPAPSPLFVAPAAPPVLAAALAQSHLAADLGGSADPLRLLQRTCVLLI